MRAARKKPSPQAQQQVLEDLNACRYLHLCLVAEDGPHCVPIRHLLLGSSVYFCVGEGDVLEALIVPGAQACLSGVLDAPDDDGFSFHTVSATGEVMQVDRPEERRQALFGLHYRHTVTRDRQEAWIFSRNETLRVYKVCVRFLADR